MPKTPKNNLLDALLKLHAWREGDNGNDVGLGSDEYDAEQRHYPHAYALWGTGYLHLHSATGDERYYRQAENCSRWLLEHPSPSYQNLSWGLPFSWRETESDLSFCITTIYCANLFHLLFETTGDQKYLGALGSIRKWLIKENGYTLDLESTKGIWFAYANHPEFSSSVYSVTAMVCGFFAKAHALGLGDKEENAYFAVSCARYVLEKQHPAGFWYYAEHLPKIDLIHTALVLEGLAEFYQYGSWLKAEVRDRLLKGVRSTENTLIRKDGFAYESYPSIFVRPWEWKGYKQTILFILNLLSNRPRLETRSFGYGMAIKALTLCRMIAPESKVSCDKLFSYLLDHHRNENGSFRFRGDRPQAYIRAEGQIFDGLAFYLKNQPPHHSSE